ncbi:MAG: tRNA (N6-threonylcarbamoyladenosine(37)-N6)-methyltransferase TrmO [Proteobacteria bacterium]|nr:tRNA (N6-threonylcarbamoyladenosine(37)-N6)-methyltransferase TrmO [Desulfobacula sp.]MBU3954061.1 tRNA (N6-threonylcarbamoyladenosine(37)-N6)-methyltransferase TrmO [Pseudomonadota bacterium]MBU4130575.1 tRNA (N6-threonylcarbamoyladenosine(37)-N6)-methyltransferase TrmO [Pseudomonadota bacterium]
MEYPFKPIGILHTCFKEKFGIPRQMNLVKQAPATLVFLPEFAREEAVRELSGFSHIWLLFVFHKAVTKNWPVMVRPPRLGGNKRVGVFASRSPFRPNPIGMSAVRLKAVEITDKGPVLHLIGVDILDKTPVLDIKPYLPYSDIIDHATGGFAPAPPEPGFRINFSDKALAQCTALENTLPDLKSIITQVLENDPRPGYCAKNTDKSDKIYGIRLFDFDLKWSVSFGDIQVICLDRTEDPA